MLVCTTLFIAVVAIQNMPSSVPESGSVWRAVSKHRCMETFMNKRCQRDNSTSSLDPIYCILRIFLVDFFNLSFIHSMVVRLQPQSACRKQKRMQFDFESFGLRLTSLKYWIVQLSSVNFTISSSLIEFASKQSRVVYIQNGTRWCSDEPT